MLPRASWCATSVEHRVLSLENVQLLAGRKQSFQKNISQLPQASEPLKQLRRPKEKSRAGSRPPRRSSRTQLGERAGSHSLLLPA